MFTDTPRRLYQQLPATFARSGTDLGLADENGGLVPTNSPTINNYNSPEARSTR